MKFYGLGMFILNSYINLCSSFPIHTY